MSNPWSLPRQDRPWGSGRISRNNSLMPVQEDHDGANHASIFSYTPVEHFAVYQKVCDGFIRHMAQATGRKVVFFPVQSYAAQYETMRSDRWHVS